MIDRWRRDSRLPTAEISSSHLPFECRRSYGWPNLGRKGQIGQVQLQSNIRQLERRQIRCGLVVGFDVDVLLRSAARHSLEQTLDWNWPGHLINPRDERSVGFLPVAH